MRLATSLRTGGSWCSTPRQNSTCRSVVFTAGPCHLAASCKGEMGRVYGAANRQIRTVHASDRRALRRPWRHTVDSSPVAPSFLLPRPHRTLSEIGDRRSALRKRPRQARGFPVTACFWLSRRVETNGRRSGWRSGARSKSKTSKFRICCNTAAAGKKFRAPTIISFMFGLCRRVSGRNVRHQWLADLAIDRRARRDRDPARVEAPAAERPDVRALRRHRRSVTIVIAMVCVLVFFYGLHGARLLLALDSEAVVQY